MIRGIQLTELGRYGKVCDAKPVPPGDRRVLSGGP